MTNKPTVTIAIPAYNEEANIESLLVSLLQQKRSGYILTEILVLSDASTDATEEIVSTLQSKHPLIKLIKAKRQKGKYYRLNQIFHNCRADILVVLDADIGLTDTSFLDNLTVVLASDRTAQMVAAHQVLLRPKGFIPRIIYASFLYWDHVRLSLPNLNTPLNYFGSATAYRGSLVRSMPNITHYLDPHLYIYLVANQNNGFRYSFEAKMVSWPLSTFTDLDRFLRRSIGKKDEKIEKKFHVNGSIYKVPLAYKLIGLIKILRQEPFFALPGLCVSFFMSQKAKYIQQDSSPVWNILTSTKRPTI